MNLLKHVSEPHGRSIILPAWPVSIININAICHVIDLRNKYHTDSILLLHSSDSSSVSHNVLTSSKSESGKIPISLNSWN